MNRRGFLQGLLTAFGAAVVEPVARGAAPSVPLLERDPTADPESELEHGLAPPAEIDLDLWLRGSISTMTMTVAYLRLKAGQRVRLRLRYLSGIAAVVGARAMVPFDAIYVESIRNHQGIELMFPGQPIDLSYFNCDDVFCPFDFGVATTEDGPVMTLEVPERCGDQELAICFFASGVSGVADFNWGLYAPPSSEVIVQPLSLGRGRPWFPYAASQRSTSLPSATLAQRADRRLRHGNSLRRFA